MTARAELPLVLTVPEVARVLRLSVWSTYRAIDAGELRCVRRGRVIRIPRAAVAEYLGELLDDEAAPGP